MTNTRVAQPSRLQAKDLINIGIFSALYIVAFFITGMVGYIPVFMLLIPALCPLIAGVVFMLFLTRVQKFGMITIMGTIVSLFMFLTGHPWPILPIGIGCALFGDLIIKSGSYKSWGKIVAGYVVFSEMMIGLMIPLFFMRDIYFGGIRDSYGDVYTDALMSFTPTWVFPLMLVLVAVGAIAGAFVGRALLKKHFKRAGIV